MSIYRRMREFRPRKIRRPQNALHWKIIQALPQAERNRLAEAEIQMALVQYLQECYPQILFKCDTSAIKLTLGQAVKMKRLGNTRAWPDIFIAEPRKNYHGCYVELKKDGEKIVRDNGNWISPHVAEQAAMLEELTRRGYYAEFAAGFLEAKKAIDEYLK